MVVLQYLALAGLEERAFVCERVWRSEIDEEPKTGGSTDFVEPSVPAISLSIASKPKTAAGTLLKQPMLLLPTLTPWDVDSV